MKEAGDAIGAVKEEKEDQKQKEILLVDDEKSICEIVMRVLSGQGHHVQYTLSGKEAIELIESRAFDVVLLDLVMPGIDGMGVLEKIRKKSPGTRVIVVTGKLLDDKQLSELKDKGVSKCIRKPFERKEIIEAID